MAWNYKLSTIAMNRGLKLKLSSIRMPSVEPQFKPGTKGWNTRLKAIHPTEDSVHCFEFFTAKSEDAVFVRRSWHFLKLINEMSVNFDGCQPHFRAPRHE